METRVEDRLLTLLTLSMEFFSDVSPKASLWELPPPRRRSRHWASNGGASSQGAPEHVDDVRI